MNENVAEGAQVVAEAPAVEKKPDSVSMSDYIGVKEMLRKSEGNLTALQGKLGEALSTSETSVAKVKELEEQDIINKQDFFTALDGEYNVNCVSAPVDISEQTPEPEPKPRARGFISSFISGFFD